MSIRSFAGHYPDLGPGVYVDPQAAVIGEVRIGEHSSIWPFAVARGDVNRIEIGARTNIQDNSVLHVTHDGPFSPGGRPLLIGNDVTVGHGVILHACTVGDACLIGMHATILDGALLEPRCFVGAGAVVSPGKRVGGGELWLGNPARMVRRLSDRELEQLEYSAAHYVRLKDRYLADALTS